MNRTCRDCALCASQPMALASESVCLCTMVVVGLLSYCASGMSAQKPSADGLQFLPFLGDWLLPCKHMIMFAWCPEAHCGVHVLQSVLPGVCQTSTSSR